MPKVFISHAHADKALADALKALIVGVFDELVQVEYSSDRSPGAGITSGEEWLPWIINQVRTSEICLVVLTPESLSRPWLMWESGAVTGVALASEKSTPIVPVLFRVNAEQIPGPLRARQSEYGDTREGVLRILQAIYAHVPGLPEKFFDLSVKAQLDPFLASLSGILRARPMALSEAAVQEWCERLDALKAEKRMAEVSHLHAAMLRVFSPAEQSVPAPLDVRIHRRLGDMYLAARQGAHAATQFELALRLVPADLFLKHKLALAQIEAGNRAVARALIDEMEADDPQLTSWNTEVAGLKGRVYRAEWEQTRSRDALQKARDAYAAAMVQQPNAYYLADNVGQLSLALGEKDAARNAFREAAAAIARLKERSIWSLATLASAAIVLDDGPKAEALLRDLAMLGPSPREIGSIEGGLARLKEALAIDQAVYDRWIEALKSQ